MGDILSPDQAKALILICLGPEGEVIFTRHARQELANDEMTEQDALNVLRGGTVSYDGHQRSSHRYQVNTAKYCVVIAFDSVTRTVVITAWRKS